MVGGMKKEILAVCVLFAFLIVAFLLGATIGTPIPYCKAGTSSIDQYGNVTTIYYPKGCVQK